jgi:23S rRNA (adenine2503-C2)-methyltransferase
VTTKAPAHRPGLSATSVDDLTAWVSARGEPGYRLGQLLEWTWRHAAGSADEMRTLPAGLRSAVDAWFRVSTIEETTLRPADGGLTEKALHRLGDNSLIESVLMRYPSRPGQRARATVCISSQVGCAIGCPFCATGELGFGRHLEIAEIVDQVRFWACRLMAQGAHVTNIVFMGMGEPLLNLDAVIAAAAALTDPRRFGLGGRHLAVSTSGIVPGILRLAELAPPWTLAISLHAVRAELRDRLVPVNRRYPAEAVVAAASRYARTTGRRVSYEYVMIDGVNDTPADAADIVRLLRGELAHVNLIPMNPVAHTLWQPTARAKVAAFAAALGAGGVGTTIRRTRGDDIGAACGQLAAEGRAAPPRRAEAPLRSGDLPVLPGDLHSPPVDPPVPPGDPLSAGPTGTDDR